MWHNPYASVGFERAAWLRANFHFHSGSRPGDSCGILPLDQTVEAYRDLGYGALAVTNHDWYTDVGPYRQLGVALLDGYEFSQGPHMLMIGAKEVVRGGHREAIAACARDGGFTVLCHPHWQREEYWPLADALSLEGYAGIEILNGVIFRLGGTGLAADLWDALLSAGRLVYGFANDDFHRWFDMGRAFNVIHATKDAASVSQAVRDGRFYASSGLYLSCFALNGDDLTVRACAWNGYESEMEYTFTGSNGRLLKRQTGVTAQYALTGREGYVRVTVRSGAGHMLFTQPIADEKMFGEASRCAVR